LHLVPNLMLPIFQNFLFDKWTYLIVPYNVPYNWSSLKRMPNSMAQTGFFLKQKAVASTMFG
jgi:hypothetical protein